MLKFALVPPALRHVLNTVFEPAVNVQANRTFGTRWPVARDDVSVVLEKPLDVGVKVRGVATPGLFQVTLVKWLLNIKLLVLLD